jgi:hypothetical protein
LGAKIQIIVEIKLLMRNFQRNQNERKT